LFFSSDILRKQVRKHLVFQGTNTRISESDRRKLKLLKTEEDEFNLPAENCLALADGVLMQVCQQEDGCAI
jgi:hypothetical protein